RLPESRRFLAAQEKGTLSERWHAILGPTVRRWLILVVVTTFLTQLIQQASTFTIDFLETDRGLSATAANFMLVFAGLPGIPIMVLAGALSDRFGRRVVGCAFAFASVAGAIGFFWLPGGIPVLLPCMSLTIVGQLGAWPVLQTYTSELFPTGLRSSASAWANVAGVLGRSGSLALAAPLLAVTSQSVTATVLGIGPFVAIIMFATMFPDTHGRELEDITGEELGVIAAAVVPCLACGHGPCRVPQRLLQRAPRAAHRARHRRLRGRPPQRRVRRAGEATARPGWPRHHRGELLRLHEDRRDLHLPRADRRLRPRRCERRSVRVLADVGVAHDRAVRDRARHHALHDHPVGEAHDRVAARAGRRPTAAGAATAGRGDGAGGQEAGDRIDDQPRAAPRHHHPDDLQVRRTERLNAATRSGSRRGSR